MKEYYVNVIKINNTFGFFTETKVGAIISHKDYEKGKKLFENGMHLSIAVKNFINFAEDRKDLWEKDYVFIYKPIKKIEL